MSIEDLTALDLVILRHLASGLPVKTISRETKLSDLKVQYRASRILAIFNAANMVNAVYKATKQGII